MMLKMQLQLFGGNGNSSTGKRSSGSSNKSTQKHSYKFNPKEVSQVNITMIKDDVKIPSTAKSFKDFQARINATKGDLRGFTAKIDIYDKNSNIIESKSFTDLKKLKKYYK